jgi:hypothetical protein
VVHIAVGKAASLSAPAQGYVALERVSRFVNDVVSAKASPKTAASLAALIQEGHGGQGGVKE